MSHRPVPIVVLLAIVAFVSCTKKSSTEPPKQEISASITVSDPTPPDPPKSTEVRADLNNMPTFMLLAIGGIADEGEKEGIDVQEDVRIFQTDAARQEITSFYAREMKARGWTNNNQTAQSAKVGLTLQEYRRAGTAMYLIISEPEDPNSSDPAKAKRHVALLPAKLKKPTS